MQISSSECLENLLIKFNKGIFMQNWYFLDIYTFVKQLLSSINILLAGGCQQSMHPDFSSKTQFQHLTHQT